jgi:TRAP-type C4-dicarboxylate transport system permease small subunit
MSDPGRAKSDDLCRDCRGHFRDGQPMSASGIVGAASRVLTWIGGLALLIMTLWTVTDVVTRYALSKPLKGSIDLVEVTLVLVVFLALPECFLRDEQITVDVVDHMVGPRLVELLKLTGAFATMLFLLILGYTGIQPFLDALQFGDRKPDLPVPIYWLLGTIQVSIGAAIVVLVGKFLLHFGRVLRWEAA